MRLLRSTDYAAVKRLFREVFAESEDQYLYPIWRKRGDSFGYWIGDQLVGVALVHGARLEYLFVSPEEQGQGIGTKLLATAMERYPVLNLTPVDDEELICWYEKKGFRLSRDGDRPIYVRHSYATRLRSAILTASASPT